MNILIKQRIYTPASKQCNDVQSIDFCPNKFLFYSDSLFHWYLIPIVYSFQWIHYANGLLNLHIIWKTQIFFFLCSAQILSKYPDKHDTRPQSMHNSMQEEIHEKPVTSIYIYFMKPSVTSKLSKQWHRGRYKHLRRLGHI